MPRDDPSTPPDGNGTRRPGNGASSTNETGAASTAAQPTSPTTTTSRPTKPAVAPSSTSYNCDARPATAVATSAHLGLTDRLGDLRLRPTRNCSRASSGGPRLDGCDEAVDGVLVGHDVDRDPGVAGGPSRHRSAGGH